MTSLDVVSTAPTELDPFEGYIDSVQDGIVYGWAWFPSDPGRAATVELYFGEQLVGEAVAEQFREDLVAAGKRQGLCGFALPASGVTGEVHVRLKDGRKLVGVAVVADTTSPSLTWPISLIGVTGYLDCFGPTIRGWVRPTSEGAPVRLHVFEDETELFTIEAGDWRLDLEDVFGDGRGGFDIAVPNILRDGRTHLLDIRANGRSLLPALVPVTLPRAELAPAFSFETAKAAFNKVARDILPLHFSIIVNFYNMRREAERTLTSMTRAFQRNGENIRYEVLCIDNGSNPPLDEDWIKSFGEEFRLVRPSKILPSPCFAINEAARQARGRHVAIVIDGAHVLSPGVFQETKLAVDEDKDAVVALRHWFVGGDQRWLSVAGYTRQDEDVLFSRINWPRNGYDLFTIGTAMSESPSHWFAPLAESNCLFLPLRLWREIGGLDERFEEPGGGFCNLDLMRRARLAAKNPVVTLIGEATFHQFHEGTTTNVSDEEKDSKVRAYANIYRLLRDDDFANIETHEFRIRGQMPNLSSYVGRQRPDFPSPLAITDMVRPGAVDRFFDPGTIRYMNGAYAESGLDKSVRWRGTPVNLAPADLIELQDILTTRRPERIVVTADEPGLLNFLEDMAAILGLADTRIICVADAPLVASRARVDYVVGPLCAAPTLANITAKIGAVETTLVLFAPRPEHSSPVEELLTYGRFVSFHSYMVVLRTARGQPWLGYSKVRLERAIQRFLAQSDFEYDHTRNQQLLTMCPNGYLIRVNPPSARVIDDAVDDETL